MNAPIINKKQNRTKTGRISLINSIEYRVLTLVLAITIRPDIMPANMPITQFMKKNFLVSCFLFSMFLVFNKHNRPTSTKAKISKIENKKPVEGNIYTL
jgi:hypothetical protein